MYCALLYHYNLTVLLIFTVHVYTQLLQLEEKEEMPSQSMELEPSLKQSISPASKSPLMWSKSWSKAATSDDGC